MTGSPTPPENAPPKNAPPANGLPENGSPKGRLPENGSPKNGLPERTSPPLLARAPLLVLAAALWSGIALASVVIPRVIPQGSLPTGFAIAGAILAAGLLAAALFAFRRPRHPKRESVAATEIATFLLIAAVFLAGVLSRPPPGSLSSLADTARALGEDRLTRPVRLEGVLLGEVEDYGRRSVLRLRADRLAANQAEWAVEGQARVTVNGARANLRRLARGARISVWSRVSEPRPPGNPGGRQISGPIALFGSTKSGLLVRELEPGPAPWRAIRSLRASIRDRLLDSGLPPPTIAVVAAMLIGDRTLAPPEVERAFRDAGTLHLMAVSGLHVGIISLFVYGLALLLGLSRRRALELLLVVLPIYAALSGGRPSVVRAVLMATVVILGMRRGLFGEALNGLGLAAILLLAFSPWNALDVGFQLSFAATLAIVAALRPRDPAEVSWERPGRWREFVIGPVLVTLAAQLATFPIIAWHFGRVVFGGVLVAVPAALLAGPVLGLGFGWLLVGKVPVLGETLRLMLGLATDTLIGLSEWGASLRFGAFSVARPGPLWLLLWLALALVVLVWRGRRRLLPAGLIVALALAALPWRDPSDGTLRLTALDVGIGDALVVGLPEGGAVLVDAGTAFGGWSAGEEVILPFLAERGYRRLAAVVATHGDLDHIGGASAVFRELPVGEVWEGRGTAEDDRPTVARFHRERERRGIPLRSLRAGDRFRLGGAEFRVLAAGDLDLPGVRRPNETSLVLSVEYAGRRILLTGDAGEAAEEVLLARHGDALAADVLKVGHHGSRSSTSPAFLAAVAPEVALVSVRVDRRRRLPDDGVLERLAAAGVRVFRTDESGAITVAIAPDGGLSVETFLGPAPES